MGVKTADKPLQDTRDNQEWTYGYCKQVAITIRHYSSGPSKIDSGLAQPTGYTDEEAQPNPTQMRFHERRSLEATISLPLGR